MVKVMVADDSTFMRKILKGILEREGYDNVIEAIDGEETVDKFKKEKPDLVLLDIIMEKKDGVTALKEMKKINPKSKFIIISAIGQDSMVKEAMQLGASNYIVKPFKSQDVALAIRKAL